MLTSASVTPCCTFSGEDSSQLMTVGELTRAKLTTFLVNTDVGHFVESDNGIKILQTGYYQISGSAYIECIENTGIRTVHLFKNDTELAMVRSEDGVNYPSQGGIATAPKVIYLEANDVIYLIVRSMMCDGNLVPNSSSTYISIVKM